MSYNLIDDESFEMVEGLTEGNISGLYTAVGILTGFFDNGVLKVSHGGTGATSLDSFIKSIFEFRNWDSTDINKNAGFVFVSYNDSTGWPQPSGFTGNGLLLTCFNENAASGERDTLQVLIKFGAGAYDKQIWARWHWNSALGWSEWD